MQNQQGHNNYMIQSPKYQLARKSRKLYSRDKKQIISFHGSRQKSRDSEDKKIVQENSPNKPHQLISNLRFELTNLRQEVAKLSKKEHKRASANNQIKLEYESRSPRSPKPVNSYYFDDVKTTLPDEETTERTKNSSINQEMKMKSQQKSDELQKLKQQIIQIQVKNNELVKANQDLNDRMKQLGERLKRQYEIKIHQIEIQKERIHRQKETEENDRTISYQKQVLENKNLVEELKRQVAIFTQENQKLKEKIENYKIQEAELKKKELIIHQKDGVIESLQISVKSLQLSVKSLEEQKERTQKVQNQNKKLTQEIAAKAVIFEQLKSSIDTLTRRNNDLQKKMIKLSQKNVTEIEQGRKGKPMKFEGQQLKQLQEVISMQQKSLMNQQSDLNYLENEVRKLSFFKHLSKHQSVLLESLNEEIVVLKLKDLNLKFNKFE